jgi:hypothetical protein
VSSGHHQEGASAQYVLVSFGGGCIPYAVMCRYEAVFNIGRPRPTFDLHAHSLNTLVIFVLQGTNEEDKKQLLLGQNINYDTLPEIFRKGSCLINSNGMVNITHEDLEGELFWTVHPNIL